MNAENLYLISEISFITSHNNEIFIFIDLSLMNNFLTSCCFLTKIFLGHLICCRKNGDTTDEMSSKQETETTLKRIIHRAR